MILNTTHNILKMDLERSFLNNEIDDLYADYIMQNADESHPIANDTMLNELMTDLYLHEEFINYLLVNDSYAEALLKRIKAPAHMKGFM